jgi:aspartate/methionine/tyrosine aminotransferase
VGILNQIPGIRCRLPDGAFYAFPNVQEVLGRTIKGNRLDSSLALATYLLESAYVATVPGEAFGTPGYLRLSYACSMATIREGLARIAAALTVA